MLQLHSLLLASNTASTPEGIVLAVATKCHCSHSLKSHISMQIKARLGNNSLWLGRFRCRSLLVDIVMSPSSATDNPPSQGCFPPQVTDWDLLGCNGERDRGYCRRVQTRATRWCARTLTGNTRNLR